MALPKEPDRLKPQCEFPAPMGRDCPDEWLDYGTPPPGYDPPTTDPVRNTVDSTGAREGLVRLGTMLLIIVVLGLLWWIGMPTAK